MSALDYTLLGAAALFFTSSGILLIRLCRIFMQQTVIPPPPRIIEPYDWNRHNQACRTFYGYPTQRHD